MMWIAMVTGSPGLDQVMTKYRMGPVF